MATRRMINKTTRKRLKLDVLVRCMILMIPWAQCSWPINWKRSVVAVIYILRAQRVQMQSALRT